MRLIHAALSTRSAVAAVTLFGFVGPLFGQALPITNAADLFRRGLTNGQERSLQSAAACFQESARLQPAAGTFLNLGNVEWQRGRRGEAILAWERAVWVDTYYQAARQNLHFGRRMEALEGPDLSWYEVISTWLPVNWWPWITAASLWLSVGILLAPGIFRQRKRDWHQAAAAFGLMVFLLSLPAHLGVNTRSRIGFVLQRDTSLRLTPTREAQVLTRLAAGEPGRLLKVRGDYALVRMGRLAGWIERNRFGLISPGSARLQE